MKETMLFTAIIVISATVALALTGMVLPVIISTDELPLPIIMLITMAIGLVTMFGLIWLVNRFCTKFKL